MVYNRLRLTIIYGPLMFSFCSLLFSVFQSNDVFDQGTVLWSILKRILFKQCLIYTRLSFKKDGFKNKLYPLPQIKQDFFKWYCLKIYISLKNAV